MSGIHAAAAGLYPTNTVTVAVEINNQVVFDISTDTATASYSIVNDGTVRSQTGTLENWLTGGGVVSNYEVRATLVSGTLDTSDPTGVWLSCSTTRSWVVTNSRQNNSVKTAQLTIEIRQGATVLDSASVTLQAESDNTN